MFCEKYISQACHEFEKAPYVCNNCPKKKLCVKDKYVYSAKHADAAVSRRRSESRKGVRISDEQKLEMDTVKGVREQGKRLLTMIFRKNNVMLLFLMPDGKAESVKRIFDYLEAGLGIEVFRRLFPDYCEPMASWQKGCIEKNHEFIRYAILKKKSLNPYNQDDITLLMNRINSIKRPGLGNKSPYELVEEGDNDFHELMKLLKMHLISPDEVHLMPDLFFEK